MSIEWCEDIFQVRYKRPGEPQWQAQDLTYSELVDALDSARHYQRCGLITQIEMIACMCPECRK